MRTPDAVIIIKGNRYALFRKEGKTNPHMIELATEKIPYGDQRPLLRDYLLEHGVDLEPWEKKTTHWCIHQAIKIAENKR